MSGLRTPKRLAGVKKKAHNRSPKQEKELAVRLGGKQVKGSGCGFEKGDVRVKGLLRIEAKCTEKNSFSVTREMVEKIENAACASGELPMMVIELMANKDYPKQTVLILPEYVLDILVGNAVK